MDIGVIVAFSASLTLPSWLSDYLSDRAPVTLKLAIMDTDIVQFDLHDMARDSFPRSSHFGRLVTASGDEFSKTF